MNGGGGVVEALAGMADLDADFGIRCLMGDAGKYADMLRRYREGHVGDMDRLRVLLAGGDMAEAVRLVHSLKGLSGNLGMTRIRALAAGLETSLRDGVADPVLVDGLEQALRGMLAAIAALPAATGTDTGGGRVDLDRLADLLAVDDLAVNAYVRAHRAELDAPLGVAAEAFVTLVEACRYREALDLLRAVTGRG